MGIGSQSSKRGLSKAKCCLFLNKIKGVATKEFLNPAASERGKVRC